jgi:hypothetical protein
MRDGPYAYLRRANLRQRDFADCLFQNNDCIDRTYWYAGNIGTLRETQRGLVYWKG